MCHMKVLRCGKSVQKHAIILSLFFTSAGTMIAIMSMTIIIATKIWRRNIDAVEIAVKMICLLLLVFSVISH